MISRRAADRAFNFIAEFGKMVFTLAMIVLMLSVALWAGLGINPLREVLSK